LAPVKAHLVFWPVVICGIALDLWSKSAVFEWLSEKQDLEVTLIDGFLKFVMAVNPGAAFGIGSGQTVFLLIVSFSAMLVILGLFIFSGKGTTIYHFTLGLFMAGICGNLYDRLFNDGFVRDFVDCYIGKYHWPAFNVADSMLCIATAIVALGISGVVVIADTPGQKHDQQQKSENL